jgi:hypothetical protein
MPSASMPTEQSVDDPGRTFKFALDGASGISGTGHANFFSILFATGPKIAR